MIAVHYDLQVRFAVESNLIFTKSLLYDGETRLRWKVDVKVTQAVSRGWGPAGTPRLPTPHPFHQLGKEVSSRIVSVTFSEGTDENSEQQA